MMLLSIFYFFSSLILVVNSVCKRDKPRKEGFLRSTCIPGFYEGSCLIILEKQSLHDAIETCKYDYGGRLATAPTKDAIQIWIRTIYFNTKYTFDNDTRFWIGYGKNDQNAMGFKYEKPNEIMENYIGKSIWNRVFGQPKKSASIQWENNADKSSLENSVCPNHGVVFNHKTAKFDIKHFAEKHYSLCETPRWAKLQCNRGWHLVPQLRMCLNVHQEAVDFLQAHSTCNSEGSFIATAQNDEELDMIRNIIVPYNLPDEIFVGEKGFWVGLKSFGRITFSMDGTKPIFGADANPEDRLCAAAANKNFCLPGDACVHLSQLSRGLVKPCYDTSNSYLEYNPLPYMCQKFADSSKISDFGLCCQCDESFTYQAVLNKKLPVRWLSIEALVDRQFSEKSDVWAFGVLLYEMCTNGSVPYASLSDYDIIEFLKSGKRLEKLESTDPKLYDLMLDCWKESVYERLSFSDVTQKLQSQLEEETQTYGYLSLTSEESEILYS